LEYNPAHDYTIYEDDDGLGYYEDGVKRTLTDEQIEMFRHSEMEQLIRDGLLESEQYDIEGARTSKLNDADASSISPASSIEGELASAIPHKSSVPHVTNTVRQPSPGGQSDTSQNTAALRRKRETEVPYDQRNKRKWEGYIEDVDSEHGSLTHRRIVRELDEQRTESIELEY
jgi:hypothetical protein